MSCATEDPWGLLDDPVSTDRDVALLALQRLAILRWLEYARRSEEDTEDKEVEYERALDLLEPELWDCCANHPLRKHAEELARERVAAVGAELQREGKP